MKRNIALLAAAILFSSMFSCQKEDSDSTDEEVASGPNVTISETADYTIYKINNVSFKMIKVQGGTFQMGGTAEQGSDAYSDELPVHYVTLSDYYIGETEVTQELWEIVMGSNPSYFTGDNRRPVEKVSWNDCQTFVAKLDSITGRTFRLPTEAEWEYAARGGNRSGNNKFAGSNSISTVAWYGLNSFTTTHPVKTLAPNELGLYDMSGNVWEWCNDWYGSYSSDSQTNPQGPSTGTDRVNRGGSWDNSEWYSRVSIRNYREPVFFLFSMGLRLAQ